MCELPWARGGSLPLRIPSAWQVVTESDLEPSTPMSGLWKAIQEHLASPTGSVPLRDLVGPEIRIALITDEESRPTSVPCLAGKFEPKVAILDQGGVCFPVLGPR